MPSNDFTESEPLHASEAFQEGFVADGLASKSDQGPRAVEQSGDSSERFAAVPVSKLLVLEVFAGTARPTKAICATGLKGVAFDKTLSRAEKQAIFQYDSCDPFQLDASLDFVRNHANRTVLIHLAPPCGTASRARQRKIHSFKRLGLSEPKPLRSDTYPDGIPGLSGKKSSRLR